VSEDVPLMPTLGGIAIFNRNEVVAPYAPDRGPVHRRADHPKYCCLGGSG
jgi:hypothetical protein